MAMHETRFTSSLVFPLLSPVVTEAFTRRKVQVPGGVSFPPLSGREKKKLRLAAHPKAKQTWARKQQSQQNRFQIKASF